MPRPNNGPKLFQATNGVYYISVTDKGRSRRVTTGTRDLRTAQKVLSAFLLIDERERFSDVPGAFTVHQCFGDINSDVGNGYWHEHVLKKVGAVPAQRMGAEKILAHFGPLECKAITEADVEAFVAKRRDGRIGKGGGNAIIRRDLSVLIAALNHAVKHKRLAIQDKPHISMPESPPPRQRWLTRDEAKRLLTAARGTGATLPRAYRFIVLALSTASRRTAILELRKDQVDLENGFITLNPSGRAQTKKRRPQVPISDELRPILTQMMTETKSDYLLDHPGNIGKAFARAIKEAGLEGVTPHTLRHTWATWAAQAGVPMVEIAGVLGDNINTVFQNYLHYSPSHLRSAVNAIRWSV